MLAPVGAARAPLRRRQPPGAAAAGRPAAARALDRAGRGWWRARRSGSPGRRAHVRPRSRGGCAKGRAPAFPPVARRRAAARRHGVRPARARGGRPRRASRSPAGRTRTGRCARSRSRSRARSATPRARGARTSRGWPSRPSRRTARRRSPRRRRARSTASVTRQRAHPRPGGARRAAARGALRVAEELARGVRARRRRRDVARAGGEEVGDVEAARAARERRDALLQQQALDQLGLGLVARPATRTSGPSA